MSEETSATYNVRGTVTFREGVSRERAEDVLQALGSLGLDLYLQPSEDQLSIAQPETHDETLPDRFVTVAEMVDFAQRSGTTPPVAAKVWRTIDRVLAHKALGIDPLKYEQVKDHNGELHITRVSLSLLRDLLTLADSVAPPHIRSKDIRRMHLEEAFGISSRFGPKSVEFVRYFVADSESNMTSSANS